MFRSVEAAHPSELSYCEIRSDPARIEPEEEYTWVDAFADTYGAVLYGAGCVLAGMVLACVMMMGGV